MPRQSTAQTLTCQQCGERFTRPGWQIRRSIKVGRPLKYCSQKCNGRAHAERRPPQFYRCLVCDKAFTIAPYRRRQGYGKYCSRDCYHRADQSELARVSGGRRSSIVTGPCEQCGTPFDQPKISTRHQRFCSRQCLAQSQRVRIERECCWCGSAFDATPSRVREGKAKYCCLNCYYADLDYRRRPYRRAQRWVTIRREVWERDKGICHVCHRFVTFSREYHCGHIVDRAMGGGDDLDNLVVMCEQCNPSKPHHQTKEEYETWRLDR